MALCLPSLSDLRAERTLTEINQELRLQLAKYKQDFRDLTEKFLISQATSYSLANQLQKYKCEACKDIVESVLGEKLLFEVRRPAEKLAEKPTLDERLRTCATLIRSQARELTQLRQTLRDGKDDSVLLKQHLEDLLTRNDPDSHQGQGFRESLSEGYRVAKRLACKLSPEMYEDEEDEQAQEKLTPSVNLQDDEEKVVFQQSQDECVSVPSTLREGSACNQPSSDGEFAFDEENVASAVDGACGCSQAEEDEIPTGLPENQNDHDDLKSPEVVAPRFSRQLPQMRENGVPRDSLDEYYLTYSVLPDLSDSFWPYRSNAIFSPEDVDVSYARDVTKNLADLEDEEDQDIISSSYGSRLTNSSCLTMGSPNPTNLSVEQLVVEENEVQPDSLDECYLAASVGHHLAGSCHPYRSASFPTERREVFLALDVNGDTWEDCHRGPVSFPGSEVPTSQAQLQESTHVTDCLQWQLDQHFDCGDSKAMLGLSSTNGGFTSNPDSGNQGPLFLELGASISMKNPPKLQVVFDGRDIDFFAEDRSVVYSKVYISQLSDHFLMINSGEPFLPRTPSSACCELPSAACGG
ncbi:putative neuroblastoma breakpoint family member 5 [Bos indicus x Bos taurus]|uniref:putative neuroblastoma breakpoint family member 5 n=1 Tax=Bos indicus x Bos taurus TaxID=30522 RepID=UPI000F7D24F7|nr:putative neuroblastoma breakpoint family member 5 [Bos indicus x Bos taurus]